MSDISSLQNEINQLKSKLLLIEADNYYKDNEIINLRKKLDRIESVSTIIEDVFLLRTEKKILFVSDSYTKKFSTPVDTIKSDLSKHYESIFSENYMNILKWNKENVIIKKDVAFKSQDKISWFLFRSHPILDKSSNVLRRIEVYSDITELKKLKLENNKLFHLLPICASCKKIRDENGSWHDVEIYIKDTTGKELSHSLCPVCTEKLYGNILNQ